MGAQTDVEAVAHSGRLIPAPGYSSTCSTLPAAMVGLPFSCAETKRIPTPHDEAKSAWFAPWALRCARTHRPISSADAQGSFALSGFAPLDQPRPRLPRGTGGVNGRDTRYVSGAGLNTTQDDVTGTRFAPCNRAANQRISPCLRGYSRFNTQGALPCLLYSIPSRSATSLWTTAS